MVERHRCRGAGSGPRPTRPAGGPRGRPAPPRPGRRPGPLRRRLHHRALRALGGNSFSWVYVFEWPIFAGFAVYMWWNLLHGTDRVRRPEKGDGDGASPGPPRSPASSPDADAELEAGTATCGRWRPGTGPTREQAGDAAGSDPPEDPLERGRHAALAGVDPVGDEDQRRDGPEVPADPEDARRVPLVAERGRQARPSGRSSSTTGVLVKMAMAMASTSISKAVTTTAATCIRVEPRAAHGCDGRMIRQNR